MTEEDIKKLQSTGGEHLAATEKNILGNDISRLWKLLGSMKNGRIDFVLDNAGFELYCDCVYADWLIQSGIASSIHFHGKRFAWFVSDVTRKDWEWLLNSMVYGSLFPDGSDAELASLKQMGNRWKSYEKSGKWVYEQHPLWVFVAERLVRVLRFPFDPTLTSSWWSQLFSLLLYQLDHWIHLLEFANGSTVSMNLDSSGLNRYLDARRPRLLLALTSSSISLFSL